MTFGSGNWSGLPGDVWFTIGSRLDAPADRIRFRAVSKSLRSNLPYRQPPWLLLPEFHQDDPSSSDDDEDNDGIEECVTTRRRFVILGEQRFYKFHLPQASLARCVGSTNSWLITVKTDTIVRLLNPFSKLEIRLPADLNFGDPNLKDKPLHFPMDLIRRNTFLRKVIISPPPPPSCTCDFLVIAIHNHGKLAMCRPHDSCWTTLSFENIPYGPGVRDLVVYNGLVYAITFTGLLWSGDVLTTYPNPTQLSVVGQFDVFKPHPDHQMLYLVEWCGYLLLVIKSVNIFLQGRNIIGGPITTKLPFYKTESFEIYKFDFTIRNWNEIKSLGEYSLFLGFNTSVSVLASDYVGFVKKNCIYFTDDFHYGYHGTKTPGGYDMGVFNLDDNTITPHYKGESTCFFSPPVWIVPQ